MYKTKWLVREEKPNEILSYYYTQYHFSKNPKLELEIAKPTDGFSITFTPIDTWKLCNSFSIFWKCVTHEWKAERK